MTGIEIERLFGYFNYHIELADEGITILTGPNGYGKSAIIRCINALRNSDVHFFLELDFLRIEIIKETEKENLLIEKTENGLRFNNSRSISKEDNFICKRGIRYRREIEKLEFNSLEMDKTHAVYDAYKEVLELMQQSVGEVECIEEQRLIRVEERRGMRTAKTSLKRNSGDGIRIVDENDRNLKLSKLSSGEKEILVLFCQLLFEVKDGVMLLVTIQMELSAAEETACIVLAEGEDDITYGHFAPAAKDVCIRLLLYGNDAVGV